MNNAPEPLVYWSPSGDPEHEEAYRQVFKEWYPEYETVPGQIALERRHVQEIAELQASSEGRKFVLVKATPRFVREQVAQLGLDFTQENVHLFLNMLATLPGFEPDRIYDIAMD